MNSIDCARNLIKNCFKCLMSSSWNVRTNCYFSKIIHTIDIKKHNFHQKHSILTNEIIKFFFDIKYENDNIIIVIIMKYQKSFTFTKKSIKTINKTTRHQQFFCNFVYNEFAIKSFFKTKFFITWSQKKCFFFRVFLFQIFHFDFFSFFFRTFT